MEISCPACGEILGEAVQMLYHLAERHGVEAAKASLWAATTLGAPFTCFCGLAFRGSPHLDLHWRNRGGLGPHLAEHLLGLKGGAT